MQRKSIYRKLKKGLVVLIILIAVFVVYVEIANRNSRKMTYRQKVLKAIYPAWMWYNRVTGKKTKVITNDKSTAHTQSLYDLTVGLNNGQTMKLDSLKGKKILIVHTASNCGYTNQYKELEGLYERYKNKLVIIGFPANDFKEQEKGTDEQIAEFCKLNYGISFPSAKKSIVIPGPLQNDVFKWLTDKTKNGCYQGFLLSASA